MVLVAASKVAVVGRLPSAAGAGMRGSKLVGSTVVSIGWLPFMLLIAPFKFATAPWIGPSVVVPPAVVVPHGPRAIAAIVTITTIAVTTIKSIFQRYSI